MKMVTITRLVFSAVLLFLFSAAFFVPSADAGITVRVIKDTEVKLRFVSDDRISSENLEKGDSLVLSLAEAIVVDDSTIVAEGASGRAVVTKVEKNGKRGKPGYIEVAFVSLLAEGAFKATDGAPIKLAGKLENKGKSKKFISWLLGLGFLISGGNGEIDRDAVYTTKTVETVKLTSE
ncbi:MAG: hypothetical protein ABIK83_11200 [Candidatus Zixiibacteriota bacterium]